MRSIATHAAAAALGAAAVLALSSQRRPSATPDAVVSENRIDVADVGRTPPAERERPPREVARQSDAATAGTPAVSAACPPCAEERVSWPADVPQEYLPERFAEVMHEVAEELVIGGALEIDCDEFPCLAVIHDTKLDATAAARVQAALRRRYPDDAKDVAHRHAAAGPLGVTHVAVFGLYPAASESSDTKDGIERRIQSITSDAKGEVEE